MRRSVIVSAVVGLLGCSAPVERAHVPETGTTQVVANGLNFHIIEEGEGPLVLMLHGFPDTAHTWDEVRPVVAEAGFRVVTPFMRGYAPTEVPAEDPDHQTLGRDVLGLIEALGEDEAIVVGHDWGAAAAYAAAHLEPERIRGLLTVAIPPPNTLKPTPSTLWAGRHFVYLNRRSALPLMQRDDFAHVDEIYARWAPTWQLPPQELEPVKNAFAHEPSLDAALGYYRGIGLDESFFDAPIDLPLTLVGGYEDLVPETAFTEDAAVGIIQELDVRMLDGGHFVHRESPEAFEAVLLAFLEGI